MMQKIELEIKSSKDDQLDVARVLIKNGYRVCTETRKGAGTTRMTVLVVDKPERRAEQ